MHISLPAIFAENRIVPVVQKRRSLLWWRNSLLTEEATSQVDCFSCLKAISFGQLKWASLKLWLYCFGSDFCGILELVYPSSSWQCSQGKPWSKENHDDFYLLCFSSNHTRLYLVRSCQEREDRVANIQDGSPTSHTSQYSCLCAVPSHTESGLARSDQQNVIEVTFWDILGQARKGALQLCPGLHNSHLEPWVSR